MIFADVMTVVFIILGLLLAFPAYWLLWQALFPRHIQKCRKRAETNPIAALAIGIPLGLLAFAVNVGLLGAPLAPAKVLGVIGMSGLFGVAFGGASGLCWLVGERLPSVRDKEQAWRPVLRGGVILELSYLLPFLGWFILLPVSLMFGLGCWVMAWFTRLSAELRRPQPELEDALPASEYSESVGALS